jgi:transcriptional regulator with XRE-family HTH domain
VAFFDDSYLALTVLLHSGVRLASMQPKRRTTALVLTGAVGLASAAYGLGSQSGDGSAAAGSADDREGRGGAIALRHGAPPFAGDLADALGVNASELRQALRAFHEREHTDRRAEFAAALAKALDVPEDRVTAGLDEFHANLDARMEGRREAFREGGPPPHRGPHRIALPLRQLASALDVSRAELREALREIRLARPDRSGMRDRFEEHNAELAAFLAERFDLDVDEVRDALADLPRPAPPHGGRPGPGGPGAFGPPR